MSLKVGLQLFSVRKAMKQDPLGTIEKCAEIGYKYLQIASVYSDDPATRDLVCGGGVSADKFREKCDELGVHLLPSHFSIPTFSAEAAHEICKAQKDIGVGGIILPSAFAHTKEEIQGVCDMCNSFGEICREEGMSFFYHNHAHEWQPLEDGTFFDQLMAGTDPQLVKLELDTYWAMRGGADPIEIMRRMGSRCTLLHQKDFPKGHDDELVIKAFQDGSAVIDRQLFRAQANPALFTEIGTGIIDIQAIIDTAEDLGCYDAIILEQDQTALDEIESITISMESFKKYRNIEF